MRRPFCAGLMVALAVSALVGCGGGGGGGTPPVGAVTVAFTAPAAGSRTVTQGATVACTVNVTAAAGVQKVQFLYGSLLIGTVTSAPYTVNWSTGGLAPGPYVITARGYDNSTPQQTGSTFITIQVQSTGFQTPLATINSPANGATLSGTASVSFTAATRSVGAKITQATVTLGSLTKTVSGNAATLNGSVDLNTTTLANGTYPLGLQVEDTNLQYGSTSVTVTVQNGTPPPPQRDPQLYGTWLPISATSDGASATVAQALALPTGAGYRTLQFNSSGSYTALNYQGTTAGATQSGTWTAGSGTGALTPSGGSAQAFTYALTNANLLQYTATISGHAVVILWVRVTTLSAPDSALIATWQASTATVNGVSTPIYQLFDPYTSGDIPAVQFLADGTSQRHVMLPNTTHEILAMRTAGTWSTGGGSFAATINAQNVRGYYTVTAGSSLVLTYLDVATGNTVQVNWVPWAVAGGTHPAAFVGVWRITQIVENGTSENLATFRYWGSETVAEDLEFWNDGTGEDRQVNAGGSVVYANLGRWWAEGAGTLHLQTKDWVDSSFTLSGSTLTLSQSVFLVGTITITLQKQ